MRATLTGLIWIALISLMIADPVRVAIISDSGSRNLSELVTTELSSNTDISLVERDDLAKIGDEAKVQQLAGRDATALGKLANADGLLFLEQRADGPHTRFTAVNLGYALFDDPVSIGLDPQQEAKALVHLVSNDVSKLKLDPTKAVPISLLNLRAVIGTPESISLERNLTLLLESRLAAVPEYVVLERRHAWSLGFEHSLDPTAKPLLRGAYLIDGSMSTSSRDCSITVRVRSPEGKESDATVKGSAENLSGMADQLLAEIQKDVGRAVSQPAQAPVREAQEYLREGLWGWRAGVPDAALEAVDSAEVLGAPPENVIPLRIQILCAIADKGMTNWYPGEVGNDVTFDADTLAGKADAITRAIEDTVRYRNENLEAKIGDFVASNGGERLRFRTGQTTTTVGTTASKVLWLLDRGQLSQADDLRHALRKITGYDPLRRQAGWLERSNVGWGGNIPSIFADNWAQTLEEELAWLRLACVDTQQVLPLDVIRNPPETFCARLLKTPEEREKGFDDFVESVKGDPKFQRNYFVLKMHEKDPAVADAAYQDYLAYILTQRDQLATTDDYTSLAESVYDVPREVQDRNPKAALPLVHAILDAERPGQAGIIVLRNLWRPQDTEVADAPQIWKEVNDYIKRRNDVVMEKDGRSDASFLAEMDSVMYYFKEKYPEVVKFTAPENPTAAPPLVVTKFWYPWLVPSTPKIGFLIETCDVSPDGMWLGGLQHGIPVHGVLFHVNLTDFTSETVPLPDKSMPMEIKTTPDALYMLYDPENKANQHSLARYDLKTSTWQKRPLKDFSYAALFEAAGSLYMFVNNQSASQETSIVRYDWNADKWNVLASSRRRPAHNQFDDAAPIVFPSGIYTGPNHQPCFTLDNGTYGIREDDGNWPELFDGTFSSKALTVGDRTLVYSQSGEAVMMDANAAGPQYWTGNLVPHVRKPAVNGKPLEKVPTPWVGQARWALSLGEKSRWWNGAAFHDNEMFVLEPPDLNGAVNLLCFTPKDAAPRCIPLQFHLDDQARAAFSSLSPEYRSPTGLSFEEIEHPRTLTPMFLVVSHQGLCLRFSYNGFWFLPFSDIDAYLKSAAN